MLMFLIGVIVASIIASILAQAIGLIPRFPKWRHTFLRELINSAILTAILTIFFTFHIYPPWIVLFGIIIMTIYLSVLFTNRIAGVPHREG